MYIYIYSEVSIPRPSKDSWVRNVGICIYTEQLSNSRKNHYGNKLVVYTTTDMVACGAVNHILHNVVKPLILQARSPVNYFQEVLRVFVSMKVYTTSVPATHSAGWITMTRSLLHRCKQHLFPPLILQDG